jgi:uncharacterized Zn-binding protein involved in type VI secretion
MGKPITTKNSAFQCFAFPDVCWTPPTTLATPHGVPIPYPNIGQCSQALQASGENGQKPVKAGGDAVIVKNSTIPKTSGDEAGTLNGVTSNQPNMGKVEFTMSSQTVRVNGQGVVRLGDATSQNSGNAHGFVLGGLPTVRVGD